MKKFVLAGCIIMCSLFAQAQWNATSGGIYYAGGNVGVGVNPPQIAFEVVGNGQIVRNLNSSGYTTFRMFNNQNAATRALEIDYSGSAYSGSLLVGGPIGESASVATTGAFPLTLGTANTARMTILADGKVGIGTSSPIGKFHIDINSSNTNYGAINSSDLGLYLKNTSTTNNNLSIISFGDASGYGVAHVGSILQDHSNHAGSLFFSTKQPGLAIAERMRIDENGNVGIGTSSPQYKLHVLGSGFFQKRLTVQGEIPNDNNAAFWNNSDTGYGFYSQGGAGGRYAFHFLNKEGATIIYGKGDGNVGIGTTYPDAKLAVKGTVHAQEVKVDLLVPGPDYVFEPTYNLPTLAETEAYIKANKHLPEVPSAKEMEANGINLSEMNMLLLKKVEELTLHVIELKKTVTQQQQQLESISNSSNRK